MGLLSGPGAGQGFAAVGIEPGRTRREFGLRELGVDIRESLNDLGDARFDVIYCAHTLEHIADVGPFFSDCHRRLRDGGLLAIEIPHFDLEALGNGVLSIIGAVHPLGLSQPFFRQALPREGFRRARPVRPVELGAVHAGGRLPVRASDRRSCRDIATAVTVGNPLSRKLTLW